MDNEASINGFSLKVIDAYKAYLKEKSFSNSEIESMITLFRWEEIIKKENPTIEEKSVIPYAIKNLSEQMAESISRAYDAFEIPIIIQSYLDRIKVWMERLEKEIEDSNQEFNLNLGYKIRMQDE